MRKISITSYIIALILVCTVALPLALKHSATASILNEPVAEAPTVARVLTIGGSVAHGWDDKHHGGYLHRTFAALTQTTNTAYSLYDRTIVGANAVQLSDTLYKGKYAGWLNNVHPNIVVISWGLLNDCLPNTPMSKFDEYVGLEIQQALNQHAVVYVVSPPVTDASYTKYKVQEQAYVNEEKALVQKLNNPNVYFFDVFDQMKQYMADNHLDVSVLGKNSWHPNSMGHIIATNLLIHDIEQTTGYAAPTFQSK